MAGGAGTAYLQYTMGHQTVNKIFKKPTASGTGNSLAGFPVLFA